MSHFSLAYINKILNSVPIFPTLNRTTVGSACYVTAGECLLSAVYWWKEWGYVTSPRESTEFTRPPPPVTTSMSQYTSRTRPRVAVAQSQGSTPDDSRYVPNIISKPHPGNNPTQFRRSENPSVLARSQMQRERPGQSPVIAECRTLGRGTRDD
jgi:hypothetical protein